MKSDVMAGAPTPPHSVATKHEPEEVDAAMPVAEDGAAPRSEQPGLTEPFRPSEYQKKRRQRQRAAGALCAVLGAVILALLIVIIVQVCTEYSYVLSDQAILSACIVLYLWGGAWEGGRMTSTDCLLS